MAQRISRAKRTLRGRRLDQPGDLAVVLRVLYLVYTAGHAGRVDLAGEAIRLARQLTLATEEPEARGLLALMLLNHARMPARLDAEGRIVTLDRQDRGLWDTREIAEGVRVLQSALAVQTDERRPGRYQVEAAIAALHDDAASAEETDWPQILAWYDELVGLTGDPVRQDPAAVLGRAVAVGHVLGAAAGLRETDRLREVIGERHRWHAVRGHLHELDGDLPGAASAYAEAAHLATNVAERDHLVRQAARARAYRSRPATLNARLGFFCSSRPPRSVHGGARERSSCPHRSPHPSAAKDFATEQLAIEARTHRRTALVALIGELDIMTVSKVAEVLDGLEPQANGVRHVVLDLRGLTFMDSAGLHKLIKRNEHARAGHHNLAVVRGTETIERSGDHGRRERLVLVDDPDDLVPPPVAG